jgi:MFS superfamily sulfate permease-like transporter
MKQFLTKMWQWMGKANSENNGSPSSQRAQTTYGATAFITIMAIGFLYVLRYYPQYLMEYLIVVSGDLLLMMGISTGKKAIEVNGEVKKLEITKTSDSQ